MTQSISEEQRDLNKKVIISLLESTNRDGMNNLIEWLKRSDFFTAPSSVEYHNNCVGGLAQHSLNVYEVTVKLIDMFKKDQFDANANISLNDNFKEVMNNLKQDSIIIAALLHDVCKINYYQEQERFFKDQSNGDPNWHKYIAYKIEDKFPMGHGEKSVFLIQNFIRLTGEEALAIRWHMGQFDSGTIISPYQKYAFIQATNDYPLCIVLNLADTFATYCMETIHDLKEENKVY